MNWEKLKIYFGNYSDRERGMLLLLFSFYFILFFIKDMAFGYYIAWFAWVVSILCILGLIYRSVNFNKNISIIGEPEIAKLGRKLVLNFWRMNSFLLVFPWLGMFISSLVISDQSNILGVGQLFTYIALIAFVGILGSILYFLILVVLRSAK